MTCEDLVGHVTTSAAACISGMSRNSWSSSSCSSWRIHLLSTIFTHNWRKCIVVCAYPARNRELVVARVCSGELQEFLERWHLAARRGAPVNELTKGAWGMAEFSLIFFVSSSTVV